MNFLDNNVIQGTGHIAQAYAELVLRTDFKKAYDELTTALALFRLHDIIPKVMEEVQAKAAKMDAVRDMPPPK